MSFIRKLLSVLVINAAVLMITLSFMAWVFDATLLDAKQLTGSFDSNGVAAAISDPLPKLAEPDGKTNEQGQQPTSEEKAEVEATIRKAVDEPYVRGKLNGVVTNLIGYIKTGNPQPTIDLSDFAPRVQQVTGEIPADLAAELAKPINIAEKTDPKAFESIRKSYDLLKLFKIIGPIIALVLLVMEWFLTPAGKRLAKTAWVFIAAGLWALFWWFVVSRAPDFLVTKVSANKEIEQSMVGVVTAVLNSLSSLLSLRFLQFGLASLSLAGALLLLRFIVRKMRHQTDQIGTPLPVAARPKPAAAKPLNK